MNHEPNLTSEEYDNAVNQFKTDLANCITMEDRRDAVKYLAKRIGVMEANVEAINHGITNPYYFATIY